MSQVFQRNSIDDANQMNQVNYFPKLFCKYRHIFGKEKEGVHSIRIFNIAIVDVIGTILIAWGLSTWLKYNFLIILFVLFISSILIHKLFCVETTLTKLFFTSN